MSEFAKMTTYKKEEFLEKEILKYLPGYKILGFPVFLSRI